MIYDDVYAGLSKQEREEELMAREGIKNGRARKRKVASVRPPFEETLSSLGLLERVTELTRSVGVHPLEIYTDGKRASSRIMAARKLVFKFLLGLGWSCVDIGRLLSLDTSTVTSAVKEEK